MVDGKCFCQVVEFLELDIAIVDGILGEDLFESGGLLINFGDLFLDSFFTADFFDLLGV